MRVLFVTNDYPTGIAPGASPCIQDQKRALETLGCYVDVLFVDGQANRLNYLGGMREVYKRTTSHVNYDIVHAHYGYCGVVARAQTRCPIVVTYRGSDVLTSRERPISRFVATVVQKTIVMTAEMKRLLGRQDAAIIPYGVDLTLFQPASKIQARERLGLPPQKPLLLFPYHPTRPEKRYDLVKAASDLLVSEFPELQIVAVHDKPHSHMSDYMNACDAMAITSDREGAPVAVREAMACNLPIVSVQVGDVPDTISSTEGCYVVDRTPRAIAAGLAAVFRSRIRTKGHRLVPLFDVTHAAVQVARLYDELVSSPNRK